MWIFPPHRRCCAGWTRCFRDSMDAQDAVILAWLQLGGPMHQFLRSRTVMLLLGICGVAHAADPNLLPNGDFSNASQLTNWSGTGISWSNDDAGSDAGSGSMQLDVNFFTTNFTGSACFDVTPGAPYSSGGQSKVVAGTPGQVSVVFTCSYYLRKGCVGTHGPDLAVAPAMSTSASWNPAASATGALPSDALSVFCLAGVFVNDGVPASARFDNLFFNSAAPTTPVRLQSFDVR